MIDHAIDARLVRLNISRPTYGDDEVARIYEFEVYGTDERQNLALGRPATGSAPCSPDRGPEKAFNGSVAGGTADSWCAEDRPLFLQVDLGAVRPVKRFVVKHAGAGGENDESDTRDFNIQVSTDGRPSPPSRTRPAPGSWMNGRITVTSVYFDGRRESRFTFVDGKVHSWNTDRPLNFEEDRTVFARMFQFFYLRLAIFFGCLGMFMYLFSGEMSNRTLHYWFLAPAPREVLLAGKYAAGLIASTVIFSGGALLAFAAMIWPHDSVELQAYWNAGGMSHAFWYAAAAAFGCVGYGSVFLAVGLYVRNPIIPAAVLLAWEGAASILPHALQKISILYYLQSLCPVPASMEDDVPTLVRLLAVPAAPASRPRRSSGRCSSARWSCGSPAAPSGAWRSPTAPRPSGLSTLIKDHLAGGASRLAALLLHQILRVFSVVAPCHPGAALRDWSSFNVDGPLVGCPRDWAIRIALGLPGSRAIAHVLPLKSSSRTVESPAFVLQSRHSNANSGRPISPPIPAAWGDSV